MPGQFFLVVRNSSGVAYCLDTSDNVTFVRAGRCSAVVTGQQWMLTSAPGSFGHCCGCSIAPQTSFVVAGIYNSSTFNYLQPSSIVSKKRSSSVV